MNVMYADITLIDCSGLDDAERIAGHERQWEMNGMEILMEGTYAVGSYEAAFVVGMETPSSYSTSIFELVGSVRLVGLLTLPTEDFLLILRITGGDGVVMPFARDKWFPPGGFVQYFIRDGCLICEGETWGGCRDCPVDDIVETVICLDVFVNELETVFEEALQAIADGL